MLVELRISNLGVIADATIEPSSHMTVVTGETGAGKTLVVSGIGLLLGARADAGILRHGAARAIVEGRFTDLAVVDDALGELGAELDAGDVR